MNYVERERARCGFSEKEHGCCRTEIKEWRISREVAATDAAKKYEKSEKKRRKRMEEEKGEA